MGLGLNLEKFFEMVLSRYNFYDKFQTCLNIQIRIFNEYLKNKNKIIKKSYLEEKNTSPLIRQKSEKKNPLQ